MRKKKITDYAERFALDFFLSMLDRKNRGSKFNWDNFPKIVSRLVKAYLFSNILEPTDKEIALAGEKAEEWAHWAVKKSADYQSKVQK